MPRYLSVNPNFQLFLCTDHLPNPASNPNTTGNRSYARAHLFHQAGRALHLQTTRTWGGRSLERYVHEPPASHL